jgi:putative holliday junction resolvase
MRYMAIDFGTKRIGLAYSDGSEANTFGAFPLMTIHRTKALSQDILKIGEIAAQYEVGAIVVGMPLNEDGTLSETAHKVNDFLYSLKKRVELPIFLQDEFLSSQEAEEELIAMDVSRKRRREVIDQMAAVQILESFLRESFLRESLIRDNHKNIPT